MKKVITAVGIALAAALSAGAASAVTYATTVKNFSVGAGTVSGTNSSADALGAPDGKFVSLGDGGFITLSFGTQFVGSGFVVEVTNGCTLSGGICAQWPEQVEVFTSTDGISFGTQGTLSNGGTAVAGFPDSRSTAFAIVGGPFSFLKLVDTTAALTWTGGGTDPRFGTNAGFDVDAVAVTAVPLPAAAWLMIAGLGVFGVVARRRKTI